jgi:hypothetical protein
VGITPKDKPCGGCRYDHFCCCADLRISHGVVGRQPIALKIIHPPISLFDLRLKRTDSPIARLIAGLREEEAEAADNQPRLK